MNNFSNNPQHLYEQYEHHYNESKHSGVEYAGFWWRFVANLIDSSIIGFITQLLPFVFLPLFIPAALLESDALVILTFFAIFPVTLALIWLYYAKFESSRWQATPGKKVLNMVVASEDGGRVTFKQASIRFWARILSGIFYIGYLIMLGSDKKQTLHDQLARCVVLKKN